jgi:hypothetical protein
VYDYRLKCVCLPIDITWFFVMDPSLYFYYVRLLRVFTGQRHFSRKVAVIVHLLKKWRRDNCWMEREFGWFTFPVFLKFYFNGISLTWLKPCVRYLFVWCPGSSVILIFTFFSLHQLNLWIFIYFWQSIFVFWFKWYLEGSSHNNNESAAK